MDQPEVSPLHGNLSPLVSILTWFLIVMMSLAVLVRLAIRVTSTGVRRKEDIPICLAAALCIGQCVSTSIAAAAGIGKHQDSLSASQIRTMLMSQYVSDVLFIPTLVTAQTSTLFLIESIPASTALRRSVRWVNLSNMIWAVPSLIAFIIDGAIARNWMTFPKVVDSRIFWTIISVFNVLVEVYTVIMPCICIMPIKASWSKKFSILMSFGFRFFVIAAICARIYFLYSIEGGSADLSYKLTGFVIASQLVLTLAITTSCVPILSRFLEHFETGMLGVGHIGNGNSNNMSRNAIGDKYSTLSRRQKAAMGGSIQMSDITSQKGLNADDTEIMITTEFQVQTEGEAQQTESIKDGLRITHSFEA